MDCSMASGKMTNTSRFVCMDVSVTAFGGFANLIANAREGNLA